MDLSPSVATVEQRFLTLEQLHALADAADHHGPLVYVLGSCGLRIGEVAELRWRGLDLQKLEIRIMRSVTRVAICVAQTCVDGGGQSVGTAASGTTGLRAV